MSVKVFIIFQSHKARHLQINFILQYYLLDQAQQVSQIIKFCHLIKSSTLNINKKTKLQVSIKAN